MELLTILYALIAATIGFGGGDRAVAISTSVHVAEMSGAVADCAVAQPQGQIQAITVALRPATIFVLRTAQAVFETIAPQRIFAVATFGRRRE